MVKSAHFKMDREDKLYVTYQICGRLVCFCPGNCRLPTKKTGSRSLFDVCVMEEIKEINGTALLAELLGSVVQEKNDLVWVVPFSEEIQKQICGELFSKFPIGKN